MHNLSDWNWDAGKRFIADTGSWKNMFEYLEEPYVSPDGEKIAAIIKVDEAAFSVCENGTAWENTFDKIWYLRFAPDNRLTCLVSDSGEWTVAVDGAAWDNRFEYVWNTQFGPTGQPIIVVAQKERKYFAVTDDMPWETEFFSLSNLTISHDAKSAAAVVQTEFFNEGEILKFQKGCFSVAVNGKAWDKNFVNVWEMDFSPDGAQVAAEVRSTLYDYTIAVDGVSWGQNFAGVWRPRFCPGDGSVTAPVRISGAWTLARDGQVFWDRSFVQLWHHLYSPDGKKVAAIVAPKFGRWTIAVDGKPWAKTFGDLVTAPVFSPDGKKVACIAKEDEKWTIAVDGKPWNDAFDMVWRPVFSPDSRNVAAKVEKKGRYTLGVNGRFLKETFSTMWDPVFSPDGEKILIRAIEGAAHEEKYFRQVLPVTDILG